MNLMLTPEKLAFVLRHCGAGAVVTSFQQAAAVEELTADLPDLRTVVVFGAAHAGVLAVDELVGCDGPVTAVTRRSTRTGSR